MTIWLSEYLLVVKLNHVHRKISNNAHGINFQGLPKQSATNSVAYDRNVFSHSSGSQKSEIKLLAEPHFHQPLWGNPSFPRPRCRWFASDLQHCLSCRRIPLTLWGHVGSPCVSVFLGLSSQKDKSRTGLGAHSTLPSPSLHQQLFANVVMFWASRS